MPLSPAPSSEVGIFLAVQIGFALLHSHALGLAVVLLFSKADLL